VIGLEERLICSANEFLDVIEFGSGFRVTSQNATNADSSRSHAILQISLRHEKKLFTKISFIDLAGN
jgi:kinesin family member 2/24